MQDAKSTHGSSRVYSRDTRCKISLGSGRFIEIPFLTQFSFPNDVLYDRNISVAISMDYSGILRVYERTLEADVER